MANTKVVTKSLGGAQDLLMGLGGVMQSRAGVAVSIQGLNLPFSVVSMAELQALNPSLYDYAKLDGVEYKFDPDATVGIESNISTGRWVTYTDQGILNAALPSVYQRAGSFMTGTTITSNDQIVLWPASTGGNDHWWQYVLPLPPGGLTVPAGFVPTIGAGWLDRDSGLIYDRIQDLVICVLDHPYNADPSGTLDSTLAIKNAITAAVNTGKSVVWAPAGHYKITDMIDVPEGITFYGDGIDYWDTYRPSPTRLLKSWVRGTHIVPTGTGPKTQAIRNLMNARDTKTVSSVAYPFTDFTNNDSTAGAPATAKLFSCAVRATHAAQIKNLRIMLNNNGIDGYNNSASLALGDNWDVGLWVYDGCSSIIDTVQVVGYWRMAGILLTENDGTYTMVGNPESALFNNVLTQGRRGTLIRNAAQIDAISNTADTITLKYNPSFTLTADMKFRISGSATLYTFTGYTTTVGQITLTGVSPGLPASVPLVRAANIGNNFSGTIFNNYKSCSLDHTSGTKSADLGIGEAGALEIDGYPCRNLKFNNFKAQTTFDRLNSLLGDMRDAKFSLSEHENGEMIAYDISETQGYTGNLRYANSDVQATTSLTAFTPRDCFIDYRQFPTQFNGPIFRLKNWRAQGLRMEYFNGNAGVEMRDSDNNLEMTNGAGLRFLRSGGASNALDFYGNNITFSGVEATPLPILQLFATSKNAAFYGNASPAVDNSKSLGSLSLRWSQVFAATGTINTSDARFKSDPRSMTDKEKAVALKLKKSIYAYKFTDAIDLKGEKDARIHFGVLAQEIASAFADEGLDAGDYGMFVHETWHEVKEQVIEHPAIEEVTTKLYDAENNLITIVLTEGKEAYTEVVVPGQAAGDRFGVRYDELICFIIGAL